MLVLHIAPINTTVVNGFRFSVPGLVSAQSKIGIETALLNMEEPDLFSVEKIEKNDIKILQGKSIFDEVEEPFNKPDIVIFHGVYIIEYLRIYKEVIKKNIPYVIVPRVSLTKGAQKQKKLKKVISNLLFFNRFINHASSIHYLTNNEKKLSRKFKQKGFVVGNGIDLPEVKKNVTINKKIRLSFIGRYDLNHKGLDLLVIAINNIKNVLEDNRIKVNFYGTDFNGGKKHLLKYIESHELNELVNINDAVFGEEKKNVLMNTDVFLSPSRFEGHPMAVIEAMSYGIPCILTNGTNMLDDLIKYDAGWGAKLEPEDIAKNIVKTIQNPIEVHNKGINARKLIEDNYTWEKVAKKTVGFYKDIISKN